MRRIVQVAISLVLTVLIGYLIHRGVPNWEEAWQVMIQGRPLMFLAALFFILLHMILRALRWGVLLSRIKSRVSFANLFSLTFVKYAVNVVPPRSGEVVASVVLARKENIPAASVVAASILERILDSVAVSVLFGFYFFAFGHMYTPNSEMGEKVILRIQDYALKSLIVIAVGLLAGALIMRGKRWKDKLPAKIRHFVAAFADGFRALGNRGAAFKATLLSVAIWLSITAQVWFLLRAYLDEFPPAGALFVMTLTVIGISIPTPAGVGGYQFFMSLSLTNFFARYLSSQDPGSQAAGISNGCYLLSMVPVIVIGMVFLNYEGLSFSRISRLGAEAAEASGDSSAD